MSYTVDNAIIMAAGYSSRFAPLSYEYPKALIKVKGEVLIERQICQLREAGIQEIIIVVGYKKEQFYYLKEKFDVIIVENKEYNIRNNNSTIYAVKDYLKNSYICSADNYFSVNPFEPEVNEAYYSALYAKGETKEWCMKLDKDDYITDVTVGGRDNWYMLGHVFWTEEFSKTYIKILEEVYEQEETKGKLWESIYIEHIKELKLKIRRYRDTEIYEFDSLDELREFDISYKKDSGSVILKKIAKELECVEGDITDIIPQKNMMGEVTGFKFLLGVNGYQYEYDKESLVKCQ